MHILSSSPVSQVQKSRFTYKHLAQMKQYNVESPLRVIAHIDLDAFYAQCEMIRLGVAEDQPLAVQQWSALIAINYPARKFGISRHLKVEEARKLCPSLMAVHVATWRVTEANVAVCGYHPQTASSISTDKVSLDHYRRESKKILGIFRASCSKVEKAGIDESFVDLSGMIYDRLLERHKDQLGVVNGVPVAPYADLTEKLRLPEVAIVDWDGNHLVDLDAEPEARGEEELLDWDDIAMGIGAEIVADIRKEVRSRLGYTCSAGVACNKMLAKLGSAYQKPNQQTIVRNRAVAHFLSHMKFTKIRNLGGKLGESVSTHFSTESLSELLPIPLETLKKKLDDDTGSWLYHTIRGIDKSEVNTRTEIKSMLSAKSFRPDIHKFEQGEAWLKVFVADITGRINEMSDEDEVTNGSQPMSLRRPKTMTLHHRHGQNNKARQAPIPLGKTLDEDFLLPIAKSLLRQIEAEGRCWPCQNLSLAVGGFDDIGRGSNQGIGGWIVRGEEAKLVNEENTKRLHTIEDDEAVTKKRKTRLDIQRFFGNPNIMTSGSTLTDPPAQHWEDYDEAQFETANHNNADYRSPNCHDVERSSIQESGTVDALRMEKPPLLRKSSTGSSTLSRTRFFSKESTPQESAMNSKHSIPRSAGTPFTEENAFPCPRCDNNLIKLEEFDEHSNWHYAQDLSKEAARTTSSAKDNIRKFVAAKFSTSTTEPTDSEDVSTVLNEENAFPCPRCDNRLIKLIEFDKHSNWHAVQDLEKEQPKETPPPPTIIDLKEKKREMVMKPMKSTDTRSKAKSASDARKTAPTKPKVEKGQMKLPFGK